MDEQPTSPWTPPPGTPSWSPPSGPAHAYDPPLAPGAGPQREPPRRRGSLFGKVARHRRGGARCRDRHPCVLGPAARADGAAPSSGDRTGADAPHPRRPPARWDTGSAPAGEQRLDGERWHGSGSSANGPARARLLQRPRRRRRRHRHPPASSRSGGRHRHGHLEGRRGPHQRPRDQRRHHHHGHRRDDGQDLHREGARQRHTRDIALLSSRTPPT